MLKRFMAYYRPHKRLFALDLVTAFLHAGFMMVVPFLVVKVLGKDQLREASLVDIWLVIGILGIFDEATSSLDTESEVMIQDSLERLCEGRSTLVIAHRLSTVKKADYTYVMRRGRIVEQGTHNGLVARAGYYADLYHRNVL